MLNMISSPLCLKQVFLGNWKFTSGSANQSWEVTVLTIQRNRRGQCYQTPAPTWGLEEEKMKVALSNPAHTQDPKESQFQLLVSFHLLSLKAPNQVSNEAHTLVYHFSMSCQIFLAENDHFSLRSQEIRAQLYLYSSYEWFCLLQNGWLKNFICIDHRRKILCI